MWGRQVLAARQVGGPQHTKEVIGTAETSRDSPHRGDGDVSLVQEGDWHRIVRKGKVENGNSRQNGRLVDEKEKRQ